MKDLFKSAWSRFLGILLVCMAALPSSANAAHNFTPSELDTLVATIALYPDPLLVHVLTASTYGEQIPAANQWAQAHKDLKGEELATAMENANLSYDPSVQALIPFPTVLGTMAKYRTWSDQLGDAVSVQKEDVMDAVQRLRSRAYDHGQLKSDDQVRVEKNETIVIEPTRTEYVYVPVYNPNVVFYVHAGGDPAVRYHHHAWLGSWFGEWGWGSCWFEWDSHFIYVRDYRWYHHRPIPHHPRRYSPPPRHRRLEPVRSSTRPRENRFDDRRPENHRLDDRRTEDRWTDRRVDEHRFEDRRSDNRNEKQGRTFSRNGSWEDHRQDDNPPPSSNKNTSSSSPLVKKHSASGGNGGFTRIKR